MKLNYERCLVGKRCVLVPYRPEHVARYHVWMQDPDLLEATGSEPMTLEEEIENQQSWRDDPMKCTFIVLAKELCQFGDNDGLQLDPSFVEENLNAMVGDVNLFLSEEETEHIEEHTPSETECGEKKPLLQAEIDIMVAEPNFRSKGIGKEATVLMMLFGAIHLGYRRIFCKINKDNNKSRDLFEKSLNFIEVDFAECFQQYEYELRRDSNTDLIGYIQEMNFNYKDLQCSLH